LQFSCKLMSLPFGFKLASHINGGMRFQSHPY